MPGEPAAGSAQDENWGEQCIRAPHSSRLLLGMANFTTTPQQGQTANTFPALASKQKLASLPSPGITGSLPETKPQTEVTSQDYTTEITVVFCWISFHVGNVPDLFTTTRDCYRFLFNEMTKQQICICTSRCCNRFDYFWPKACKRGLSATAVSKVLVLWQLLQLYHLWREWSKWQYELQLIHTPALIFIHMLNSQDVYTPAYFTYQSSIR